MMNLNFERRAIRAGDILVGIDEVGRGALCGPVVVCAVSLPAEFLANLPLWARDVNDSKKLSPRKRKALSLAIQKHSIWALGLATHQEVDELNVHHATLLAMRRAWQNLSRKLKTKKVTLYIDGKFVIPKVKQTQQAVVGGDTKVFSIACASILAKVHRDELMVKLGTKFPKYDFAVHKGYGTQQHRKAIQEHGLTAFHRKSFCGKILLRGTV